MQINDIRPKDIRYNPVLCAFEALVELREGDDVFHYPAQVIAPLDAAPQLIRRKLMEQARKSHDAHNGALRLVVRQADKDSRIDQLSRAA